jgi:hypothetical protein
MNAEKVVTLEISGKIIEILEVKSGQSANGEWRKQEYVLETEAQYPKKVCFMAWGDKIDQFNIQQGETVAVSIDLESREYNGRWYTDVKGVESFTGRCYRGSTTICRSRSLRTVKHGWLADRQRRYSFLNLTPLIAKMIPRHQIRVLYSIGAHQHLWCLSKRPHFKINKFYHSGFPLLRVLQKQNKPRN